MLVVKLLNGRGHTMSNALHNYELLFVWKFNHLNGGTMRPTNNEQRERRKKDHWIGFRIRIICLFLFRFDIAIFLILARMSIAVPFLLDHACALTMTEGRLNRRQPKKTQRNYNNIKNWIWKTVSDGKKKSEFSFWKHLPSRRIPILRHFRSRQYWHWFLWCWSIGQFRLPRHV